MKIKSTDILLIVCGTLYIALLIAGCYWFTNMNK
jgi:hypothetical protein